MIDDSNCNLILGEIKRVNSEVKSLDTDIKQMNERLAIIRIEIATLKVKATMWGSFAGIIMTIVTQGVIKKFF